MDVLKQIRKAKSQVKAALVILDKEIATREKELEALKTERSLIGDLSVVSRAVPKRQGESPVVKQLEKLGQSFTPAEAKKAFGKSWGIRIAQLARRKVIEKTADGYRRLLAA